MAGLVSGADWYPMTDTETPICCHGESTSSQHQLSHPPGCCGGCLCGCCPAPLDLVGSSLSKFSRMLPLPFPAPTEPPDTPGTATSNTGGEGATCAFASRARCGADGCGCDGVLRWELALLLVPGGCSPGEYAIIPPFPLPLVDGTDASRPESRREDVYCEGRLLRDSVEPRPRFQVNAKANRADWPRPSQLGDSWLSC